MKILVIGGAGYVGAHTVIKLLDSGHSVIVFDNFSTGQILNVDSRAIVHKGDILSKTDLKTVFQNNRIEAVIHLCALKDPGESMINPLIYSKVNIIGTLNVLDVMLRNKVSNFIFSSSSAVYGEPKSEYISEDQALSPVSYYGFTKLEIERVLNWYSKITNLNFISLRYFNAAGYDINNRVKLPEKKSTNLIPKIMNVIKGEEKTLKIFGSDYNTKDGTCIRDYIHVNDLANAHAESLHYLKRREPPLLLNLATGIGYSVLDVVKKFEKLSSLKINYEFVEKRFGDPSIVVSKTKYKPFPIDWRPLHSDLETIIKSVLKVHDI
tara:strand:+ start:841 stop:1809 length:969 start_codon:yes stop_codon:yes gene_type:complete